LNQAAKYSKTQKLRIAELESRVTVTEQALSLANAAVQARSEEDTGTVSELQKQLHETRKLLNETTEELSGTRQHLSEVQERLTVAEQVTATTQQRALQESGNSDELLLELTPQHQSTTHTGDVWIFSKHILTSDTVSLSGIRDMTLSIWLRHCRSPSFGGLCNTLSHRRRFDFLMYHF